MAQVQVHMHRIRPGRPGEGIQVEHGVATVDADSVEEARMKAPSSTDIVWKRMDDHGYSDQPGGLVSIVSTQVAGAKAPPPGAVGSLRQQPAPIRRGVDTIPAKRPSGAPPLSTDDNAGDADRYKGGGNYAEERAAANLPLATPVVRV